MCIENSCRDGCSHPDKETASPEIWTPEYEINRLLKADDPKALELLLECVPGLEIIMRRQSILGTEDIRDIITDAIVYIWVRRSKFKAHGPKAKAVLAKRVYYDVLTFLKKHRTAGQFYLDDLVGNITTEVQDLHSESNSSRYTMLVTALEQLPHRRAAAIKMRYLDQRSDTFIAQQLQINESSVRSLISRGLDDLRNNLGTEFLRNL